MIIIPVNYFGTPLTYQPNTFIGGVGGALSTPTLLAAKLSISSANILNYSVDAFNNVSCYINANYSFNSNAFNSDHTIRYYIDYDGMATSAGVNAFYDTYNMSIFVLPNIASSTTNLLRCVLSTTESTFFIVSMPSMTPIGTDATDNASFVNTNIINFYTHSSNQTNNGGSPDGDITGAQTNFTNINYVTLSANVPDAISDFASGNIYGSVIETSWSAPSSTNTIDGYIVFKDGVPFDWTTSTSYTFYGLDELTEYTFTVMAFDNKGNMGGFSNVLTETTVTYQIPTGNIISYWPFNSDSLDAVGSNDGTDTSMSYVSTGGIGNSADFTGSSSANISVADAANLSFGNGTTDSPFTMVVIIKFNSLTPTQQYIFSKLNAAFTDYEYLFFRNSTNFQMVLRDVSLAATNLNRVYSVSPSTGVWYHVTITYDGSSSISGLKMYVNNVEGGTDGSTGSYVAMENGTQPLTIGKYIGGTTASLNGYLDEMAFFNVEFTEAQREDLYKNYLDGNAIL